MHRVGEACTGDSISKDSKLCCCSESKRVVKGAPGLLNLYCSQPEKTSPVCEKKTDAPTQVQAITILAITVEHVPMCKSYSLYRP